MKKILSNFNSLYNYGLWYYTKYFSSTQRVKDKLLEKSGNNNNLTKEVLEKMDSIINEEGNIRARIKHLIFRNKNINYIKSNLFEKGYDKKITEKLLSEEFIQEGETLLKEEPLKRKIVTLKEKGKSRQYIFSKFIERNEDKNLVNKILNELFPEGDNENLEKEYNKLKGKFEKNKIIEKLLRKGFSYDLIKKVVKN